VTYGIQAQATPWGIIPNPPIMDVTNYLRAIENGYSMYNQLSGLYNLIKQSYDELQKAKKSFEAFNLNDLDARDPLGSFRSITTYANRQMNYMNNIDTISNRKNIQIGNASYSLNDILSDPIGSAASGASEAFGFVAIDPFERELTLQEKAVFHSKYGMSYGNFIRFNTIGNAITQKAKEITGLSKMLDTELVTDAQKLEEIVKNDPNAESLVKQQQTTNSLLIIKNQDLKMRTQIYIKVAELYSNMLASNQVYRQNQQVSRDKNLSDWSEGFVETLEMLPPDSNFK